MTKDEKKEYDEYIRKLWKENDRIAELEREIKNLNDDVKFLTNRLSKKIEVSIFGATESKYAEIRHEICEKIRNNSLHSIGGYYRVYENTLNEIEKGEEV